MLSPIYFKQSNNRRGEVVVVVVVVIVGVGVAVVVVEVVVVVAVVVVVVVVVVLAAISVVVVVGIVVLEPGFFSLSIARTSMITSSWWLYLPRICRRKHVYQEGWKHDSSPNIISCVCVRLCMRACACMCLCVCACVCVFGCRAKP